MFLTVQIDKYRKRVSQKINYPLIIFAVIFLFWAIVPWNNYFHWDEWKIFSTFREPLSQLLTTRYNEHYIPLNMLYYYVFFKVFGLNYPAFQVPVAFFQAVNSYLLYKIVFRLINKKFFALLGMIIFGLSSVGIDNLVWSLGINYVLSGFFAFLGFYLLTSYLSSPKPRYLLASGGCLVISPLFHDFSVLYPLAFVAVVVLFHFFFHRFKNWKGALVVYLVYSVVNLSLLLYFSGSHAVAYIELTSQYFVNVILFVWKGLTGGLLTRFIDPNYYYFRPVGFLQMNLYGIFYAILILWSPLILIKVIRAFSKEQKLRMACLLVAPLLIAGYLAASLGRLDPLFGQAKISRYAYQPLLFLIVILIVFMSGMNISKRVITGIVTLFLALNVIYILNYNTYYWNRLVSRDKEFVILYQQVARQNKEIVNYSSAWIFPELTLSNYRYLAPKDTEFVSSESAKAKDLITNSNDLTKNFYLKLTVGEWSKSPD